MPKGLFGEIDLNSIDDLGGMPQQNRAVYDLPDLSGFVDSINAPIAQQKSSEATFNKELPARFQLHTPRDPSLVFDKAKAIATILGHPIDVIYGARSGVEGKIEVDAKSLRKDFEAAINKKVESNRAAEYLTYMPLDDASYSAADLRKIAQEIANKANIMTVSFDVTKGDYLEGISPQSKKPSSPVHRPPHA